MGMDPQLQELESRLARRFDSIDDRLADIDARIDVFTWTSAVIEREEPVPARSPAKVSAKKIRRRR